jgi:glucosamine-6-phosphate deaminase
MKIETLSTPAAMGKRAAEIGGDAICAAIKSRGKANIVVATGASQFEVFKALQSRKDIDWPRVTGFHLDEYIGLPPSHGASFRKYLKERFVDHVPLAKFHYVDGNAADPAAECRRLGDLIARHPVDVMFCGIGENGHLAFNDPPADFQTQAAYIIVDLDEACRRQQLGEGWFQSLEEIPTRAISMSINQILKSAAIVCSVPDERKAAAVKAAVEGPVTPDVPASILQRHEQCYLLLDEAAASRLSR